MISVALCTYNGERFIREQVDSIIKQSSTVDEIVVCDDCSVDSTINILKEIQASTDVAIKIYQNDRTMGVVKNFDKAISRCSGDYIFLSDQDDIWDKNKVSTVLAWFDDNPQKEAVFTDARLVDFVGNPIENSEGLFDAIGFSPLLQRYFESLALDIFINYNRATGATMAVKKTFFKNFSIYCYDEDRRFPLHDAQIALGAISRHSLGYIPIKLISYRIHSDQECGIGEFVRNPKRNSVFNLLLSEDSISIPEVDPMLVFLKRKNEFRYSSWGVDAIRYRKDYAIHYGKFWKLFVIYDFFVGVKHTLSSTFCPESRKRC